MAWDRYLNKTKLDRPERYSTNEIWVGLTGDKSPALFVNSVSNDKTRFALVLDSKQIDDLITMLKYYESVADKK